MRQYIPIVENAKTYNVFADGELVYLGHNEDLALAVAKYAKRYLKGAGRYSVVGSGYAYDVETWYNQAGQ